MVLLDREGTPAGLTAGSVAEFLGPLKSGIDAGLFAYGT
jgi:hypothetical protein